LFIFKLHSKKQLGLYVHYFTRLYDYFLGFHVANMIILELLACGWCWCKLVRPAFFPRLLFALAALVWALGLGFSSPRIHTHYYKYIIIIYST
jgi:hypothetical protein